MVMYHSWDSQNAWLRQILGQNFLYMNPIKAAELNIEDMQWAWVESAHGKIRVQVKFSNAVQPDTVWTWNSVGKMPGAWSLNPESDEIKKAFLLNHLITEEISDGAGGTISNSDPITGQAGWYDLKVKIYKSDKEGAWPVFETIKPPPGIICTPSNGDKKK
jgi:anaerobic selenocysteine-containing dehydrogenase